MIHIPKTKDGQPVIDPNGELVMQPIHATTTVVPKDWNPDDPRSFGRYWDYLQEQAKLRDQQV